MEPATHSAPPGRSRHDHSNPQLSSSIAPVYGYHNTFHTHAQLPLGPPPSYARAVDAGLLRHLHQKAYNEKAAVRSNVLPPAYSCSIQLEGVVGIKQELSSPFKVSSRRDWNDVYLILRGTQLSMHKIKFNPSPFTKNKRPLPGRLLKTFSLQHAEAGIASDFHKTPLIPKSPFFQYMPESGRAKLFESDPSLFEMVREHAIRVRLELEQFLICLATQDDMLDWIEALCAAVDISLPLEDRSEPRYRSLPRRNRRQRALEATTLGRSTLAHNMDNLNHFDAGRRIVAQQEHIIRQLCPHLAESDTSPPPPAVPDESEDFDPEDVRFPSQAGTSTLPEDRGTIETPSHRPDTKMAPSAQPCATQMLRYRRRCAPVLLASSPRVSDVVFTKNARVRISIKEHCLLEYKSHPPRYDAHHFAKAKRPATMTRSQTQTNASVEETMTSALLTMRPALPSREHSDDSIESISLDEERALTPCQVSSRQSSASDPPSPTATTQVKADARRPLDMIGKQAAMILSRLPAIMATRETTVNDIKC